ncbi:sensor histidine kinase [Natronorubrum texcoconense]|uniref:sensor histidine kinase n=1 Tax=Natronorubrum texcoconense TaxID=1095776 RepID=UPI000B7DA4BD|nr:histidine kinase N-terminal 7TM domain-containing protein [Natronorubrum texcoconense]
MIQGFEPYLWLNVVGVVLFSVIAVVAWRHREQPAGLPLVVFSLASAGWAIVPDLAFVALGIGWVYWGTILGYVFIDLLVVAWLYIAVEYSSRELALLPPMAPVLVAVPLLDQLVQWTNPQHGLFYATLEVVEPGPLFYVHALLATLAIVTGLALVLDEYRRSRGIYRRQALAMAWAMGLFVLTAVAYITDLAPGGSSAFSIAGPVVGGVFLWALFYADFLEVAPVARQTLVDSMGDGVVALDTQGRIIELNRAAQTVLEVDSDVVGHPGDPVFDTFPVLRDHVGSGVETTTDCTVERIGETRHYDLRISPVYTDPRTLSGRLMGRPEEYVGDVVAIRDVTDGRRKELALERTNRQLDQFTRFVSHDLRSPLGIASSYLEFAQETGDDEDFEAVRNRLERMDTILDELLELARLHGKSVEREPCQLATVARSAWDHVDTTGASLALADDQTLSADDAYLHNVFENLFRNAVEHGSTSLDSQARQDGVEHSTTSSRPQADDGLEHDSETVTIEVGALEGGTGFYVADDGPGIPAEMETAVLEQGYSTKEDGTGLGLSIVQTIVDAHGWSLCVTESENGGARFEIET